jgi:hypothetical protein
MPNTTLPSWLVSSRLAAVAVVAVVAVVAGAALAAGTVAAELVAAGAVAAGWVAAGCGAAVLATPAFLELPHAAAMIDVAANSTSTRLIRWPDRLLFTSILPLCPRTDGQTIPFLDEQ